MAQTETLLSDYINFNDQNVGLSGQELINKELTFCAAAAVSCLCDEQEKGIDIDECLQQKEEFKFVKELNLISEVYNTAPISKQKEIKSTPPILAWSDRLQTVFLGISCTRDMNDPKLNLNVRAQAADAVGSRFYQGLIDRGREFVPLIEWLTRQYKLVVCGHSFGGALATASSYLAVFDHQSVPNVWEDSQHGISVITFGSPSCHFAEPQGTSTSWKMHLSRNFHHVINPHDYVPFALNDASRRFKQNLNVIKTPLETISPTIKMFWPIFENCLDFLLEKKGKFCHFGCMYSIATETPGIQNCLQIRSADNLPQIPGPREVDEHHKMSHYFHCVKGSIGARLPQETLSESHRDIDPEEFPSMILPMPATVTNCSCVVENDRLTVSFNVNTAIIQYLLSEAFFMKGRSEIPLTVIGCIQHPEDHCQASVVLEYRIEDNKVFDHVGKASIALQQGITLRDIFSRSTSVRVGSVKHLSLDKASQPEIFESIRLAMVRALVAQTSKVQSIRTQDASINADTPGDVIELDEKVRAVVDRIDSLVSDASPHLFVKQMGHAFEILKALWPRDFETDQDYIVSVPGQWEIDESDTGLLRDVPVDCPRVLRELITNMFKNQKGSTITQAGASLKAWTHAKRPTLTQQFANVPTLVGALKTFSHDLYHRPTDSSKRTEQAISQFQDVMGVIQLCHLVIITQLDAPYEWYCKSTEGRKKTSAALGILPSYLSWSSAPALLETVGLSALSVSSLAVAGGMSAMYYSYRIINHLLHLHSEYLDLSFPGVLAATLQALGLPPAKPGHMIEKTLLNHLEEDALTSRTPETLEKWRVKLEKGLENYPGVKENQWSIIPDYFWAKWLFTVTEVAQLRIQLLDKICIGVQGSTEAGKSQMLTVLTGASKNHFKPGSSSLCRTLGIQSYNSSELGAIFLDSPGFDDQKPQIRYMADVYQELLAIVIIVIPMERTRSEATESALRIAVKSLLNRDDKRPLRILLSQADKLDFHRKNKEVFKATLSDVKDQFMLKLRREVGENFTTFRQQRFGDGIVCVPETLEDIVKPFSTHAQMDLDGIRALADCGSKYSCKIERASHFENLCELADAGEIWDIESLRSWLRDLSPKSVPISNGRVRKYCD
ncbi:unnamed protein product [Fusarium venenatum]|uniref:Fungal lipase-type domain-containing protein n=1 Tax=Fusarium venenatum TaxID=56646 RepID=A0A2L2TB57_9HYPO|nr:uncharacterized protein FVRRES_07007 [Fusarium venenatum]KAH6993961.1 hypothetical protein EDB82DRAFT_500336 [Fusarium venenatum]CEI62571.1 unnamed protein product [Fusarium venenatum]